MVRKKVANHRAVAHSVSTLEKIRRVRAGESLTGEHKVFGAAYRLLDPARPSPTVTRSGFRDFIHPEQDRLCTIRELARLQTFPDSYIFMGRRCDTYAKSRYLQQTQHEQLGNSVPPLLARRMAREIRIQLVGRNVQQMNEFRARFNAAFDLLNAAYPQDNLGNKSNPLDELVYVLLSRRSREQQYQPVYKLLARRFRPWSKLLAASDADLQEALRPLGLAQQRAKALRGVLQTVCADFGSTTLRALRRMSYSEAYNYLRSLPGVNDKTAKCVMLYALHLPALPVDTHTLRVTKRLGILAPEISLFRAPRLLDAIVPRSQRGRYHVLTVLHGRALCTSKNPKCSRCPAASTCPMGAELYAPSS